ncbi:hypothetical protein Ahy_A02g005093 [Arachis hypogaea]|uniref:Uncharacterized protein n=1 Tax=Arachis hypogaea TaxID=3818 RepID=A0A445E5M9_ARAHY|nr:hypothetical protein Ahy_A02g005093 [Arachis hypogaea]
MHEGVSFLVFFLAQLGYPGLEPETSLVKQSEPTVHIQETIIIAGTIRHLTLNHNDPITRAKFYQLSYILPSQVEYT